MTAAGSATAELDPEADVLVEEGRARLARQLGGRDTATSVAGAVAFFAVAVPLAALATTERSPSALVIALVLGAYALASRVEFEVGNGSAVPTQLVFVPMLFLLPAALVPLCVAGGLVLGRAGDYASGRAHFGRALVHVLSSWHAVGPALVFLWAGEPAPDWRSWPVFVLAFAAQVAFDSAACGARARLVFAMPLREQLRLAAPAYLVDAALAPVGLLLAMAAYERPYSLALVMPLVGLMAFFARERRRRIDYALELSHAYRGTAFLLGDVIEADDAYTGSHSRDVVELVLAVGERLGLDARERRHAELTALLHDVGKIRIPAEIINKPGSLTDEEFALVKTHTLEGERMLEQVGGVLGDVGRLVRSCHERWDGAGYPDGLAADDIPLVARVVCACDAYNAMTTDRPYRNARPEHEALAEMERCSGTQFDPRVVEALAAVVRGS
ncbi:MAG TPA: HD-GYP domain-containing protein [Gaiellaceae bacterium]|nr:HD-GYP domain-containing protein [Gaiellaceae bacterium]